MSERYRKLLLYIRPIISYWKGTDGLTSVVGKDYPIGFYPLSIAPRIEQGHYEHFSEDGIPAVLNDKGEKVPHWTTICSYALGNWELYLKTGGEDYKAEVLKVADFICENKIERGDVALFISFEVGRSDSNISCAMNQGEAISVLLRAYLLTNDTRYSDLALSAANAFKNPYGLAGVVDNIPGTDIPWYLEAGKYILNGHNYAVWGLWELNEVLPSEETHTLFNQGVKSIEDALPLFDAKYWSWYWADDPPYIASIMYHNLHIVQLTHLAKVSNSDAILNYAKKFKRYGSSPLNRLHSGYKLFKSKMDNS